MERVGEILQKQKDAGGYFQYSEVGSKFITY